MAPICKFCYVHFLNYPQSELASNNAAGKFARCYYEVMNQCYLCGIITEKEEREIIRSLCNFRVLDFEEPPYREILDIEQLYALIDRVLRHDEFTYCRSLFDEQHKLIFDDYIYTISRSFLLREPECLTALAHLNQLYTENQT